MVASLTGAQLRNHRVIAVEQAISAGNQFDGSSPPGAKTYDAAAATVRFAAAAKGGNFDPGSSSLGRLKCVGVEMDLGDASTWQIEIVSDTPAPHVVWQSGGGDSDVVISGEDTELTLLPQQRLLLTTTGATLAMTARFKFAVVP